MLFDEIIESGLSTGKIDFPIGVDIEINKTIELGTRSGLQFTGGGKSSHANRTQFDGSTTRLIWTGPVGDPMFRGIISHFSFNSLTFVGKIHIDSGRGMGSGNGVWEQCSFINSSVLFGNPEWNGNGADCYFDKCVFIKSFLQNTSSQNINYSILNSQINNCGTFFDCRGGGIINIQNAYVLRTPTLVAVKGPGHVFGSQNGRLRFAQVSYDAKQMETPYLFRDTGYYGGGRICRLEGIDFSPNWPGIIHFSEKAIWDIRGEKTVTNIKQV